MKKAALALAFLLSLCSFTACEESQKEDVIIIDDDLFINGETFTEERPTEEPTEPETTTVTTTRPYDEKDQIKGEIDGKIYTNKFADIKFTAPANWKLFSAKVAKTYVNLTRQFTYGESGTSGEDSDSAYIVDAMCMNEYFQGKNMIIQFFDISMLPPDYVGITSDDFLSVISYDKSNPSEIDTVTLAGKEFRKIICDTDYDGTPMKTAYYARKESGFILTIIISDTSTDEITAREKNFTELN